MASRQPKLVPAQPLPQQAVTSFLPALICPSSAIITVSASKDAPVTGALYVGYSADQAAERWSPLSRSASATLAPAVLHSGGAKAEHLQPGFPQPGFLQPRSTLDCANYMVRAGLQSRFSCAQR